MRIFYAVEDSPNTKLTSSLWRNNLYQPLVDLGHEVIEFKYDDPEFFQYCDPQYPNQKAFIDENRPKFSQALLTRVKEAHAQKSIDLFFSYFYDAYVFPEVIDEIRALGIVTVNWYCNGSYQLHLVKEISPHYDWCLVPEKFRLKDYSDMGANPIYSQEAANPNIYKPYALPREFDVTFVGQAYGERPSRIQYIIDQGIDVRVWGYGWEQFSAEAQAANMPGGTKQMLNNIKTLIKQKGRPMTRVALPSSILGDVLSDEEMIQMYSRSKINLGFSTCGDTHQTKNPILQVRLRDFEVPMSGGFYMVAYMEELEEFFAIGKEIVCYTDPKDMVEKIKYYLEHEAEREKIRKAGFERCQRDHTWHKRFQDAFQKMGLIKK